MDLERSRETWERWAEQDPFWAILSRDDKREGRWSVEDYLEEGRREISHLLAEVRAWKPDLETRRALDFGCGAGRLTQALADTFERVDGVDVAASMIELARKLDTKGGRAHFHHNPESDLRLFEDAGFDLVYSNLVLMHVPPSLRRGYLTEFLRVLSPQGLAVFQLADDEAWPYRDQVSEEPIAPASAEEPTIPVYGMSRHEVEEVIGAAGGRIVATRQNEPISDRWSSTFYGVCRQQLAPRT